MTLGDAIAEYRRTHDLSQRQFAQMVGLSNSYISLLEKNRNPTTGKAFVPTVANLHRIAKAMGMSLHDLFAMVDDMPIELRAAVEHSTANVDSTAADVIITESPGERRLVEMYRQLNDEGRGKLLDNADDLVQSGKYANFCPTDAHGSTSAI